VLSIGDGMSDGIRDEQDDKPVERRVVLPEPDVDNITVLTENLPNDPVLPWHHFDSPWLGRDANDEPLPVDADEPEAQPAEPDGVVPPPAAEEEQDDSLLAEQLTLSLEQVS
jgi:hypothetical protein